MEAFLNMRSSISHADSVFRPKSWREKILRLYPNGSVSLTALTALMKSSSVDDPEFYWFDKSLPTQAAAITAGQIYTDQACSSAYVSGGAIGDVVYVKATEGATGASEFRPGHQVLICLSTDPLMNVNGKVTYVSKTSTTVTVGVKLLEADNNSTTHDLSDADRIRIIGNINPEGSQMPDSISYDPTKCYNTTQIFRNSLSLTRTRMRTKVRYGTTAYQEAKRDCLELHGMEQEKAYIWGIYTIGTGDNGQPERTTGGLKSYIPSANITDYRSDTDFTGKTWLDGGRDFINKWLELIFRYGSRSRTAYVGSGTVLAINKLVEAYGDFQFTPKTLSYGINIMQWITSFGTIDMYIHPLFSFEASERYSMMLFDPMNLEYRYVDDTFFQKDDRMKDGTWVSLDGIKEGYLTESGLEIHHPTTMAYLTGFGYDA
jgi:hypothetical protein